MKWRNVRGDDTTVKRCEAPTRVDGSPKRSSTGCLEANEVAELLEGTLADDRRRRAENHIDQCESCRSLVASLATRLSLILPTKRSASLGISHYARGWVSTLQSEALRKERGRRPGRRDTHKHEDGGGCVGGTGGI